MVLVPALSPSFRIVSRVPDGALRSSGACCNCSKGATVSITDVMPRARVGMTAMTRWKQEANLYLAYEERETLQWPAPSAPSLC